VHLLFKQGWVGLVLFNAILILGLARLARAGWRGESRAYVLLAALAGMLKMGMFDSLLDAPRLAALLCLLMLVGLDPTSLAPRQWKAGAWSWLIEPDARWEPCPETTR
jgi:hypothetical protein